MILGAGRASEDRGETSCHDFVVALLDVAVAVGIEQLEATLVLVKLRFGHRYPPRCSRARERAREGADRRVVPHQMWIQLAIELRLELGDELDRRHRVEAVRDH